MLAGVKKVNKSGTGRTVAALCTAAVSAVLLSAGLVGCASRPSSMPASSSTSINSTTASAISSPLSNSISHNGVSLSLPSGWSFAPPRNLPDNTAPDTSRFEIEQTESSPPPFELFRFFSPDSAIRGVCLYLGGDQRARRANDIDISEADSLKEAAFLYSDALGPRGMTSALGPRGPSGAFESRKKYYIRELVSLFDTPEDSSEAKSFLLRGRSLDEQTHFLSLLMEKPSGFYLIEMYAHPTHINGSEKKIRELYKSFTRCSLHREGRQIDTLGIDFLSTNGSWQWAGDKEDGLLLRGKVGDYTAEAALSVNDKTEGKSPIGTGTDIVSQTYLVNHLRRTVAVEIFPEAEKGGMLRFEIEENATSERLKGRGYYLELFFPQLRSTERLRRLARHESVVKLIENHLRWDLSGEAP